MPRTPGDLRPKKPKIESAKLPDLAISAFNHCLINHQRQVEALAQQTLESMGLKMEDGWQVFVNEGVARRVVPN